MPLIAEHSQVYSVLLFRVLALMYAEKTAGALQSELHLAIWLYHGDEGSRQLFEIAKTILSAPSLTGTSECVLIRRS